uniref:CBS domain-containing protein CBSCBSPB5 n=1 Tax=Ananas comosus var. bracteatus TaxID=296719 RepID=A0A6V7NNK6_ANACO|nr:unnamed protein product [Ananas comosus var. bracteatus]
MDSGGSSRRATSAGSSPGTKLIESAAGAGDATPRKLSMSRSLTLGSERTVKRLRLSKALTMPENITVLEACRRMAARRVDAALLTDSNALLCGILTDKDVATRVIARELRLDDTPVSKVMTRNPVFVLSNTLAVEALQKMVQGKFRHLPVVENGEVIALLDIAKCLYDAIARMERASEKGKAIAAAVEGVEKNWGTAVSGPNIFIETLREQMFRPSLSTIIKGNSKVVTVSPGDSVLTATKKMLEIQISSAIVTVGTKPHGILTSRDILMRVIARNLSPELTPVEKVMTPNPECGTVDIPILDALRTMQDGKFLHLPVLDRDGNIVSVVDVIDITHAAVTTVTMAMGPLDDEDDSRSETSMKMASEGTETAGSPYPSSSVPTTAFTFKLADKKGRMHRFTCDTQSLAPLITCILQRLGCDITGNNLPQILYEDEDCDKVVLSSDTDLAAAVDHARLAGLKCLKLYLDYSSSEGRRRGGSGALDFANRDAWAAAYSGAAAGAALVACLGVIAYLKKYSS